MSKIIITGPTCSGKSSLKRRFIQRGFKPIIQFTTRKQRDGEFNGYDYDFYTEEELSHIRMKEFRITDHRYENGTTYGILESRWNNGDVIALGAKEILQLPPETLNECFIIFIDPSKETIKKRLLKRGDSEEEANRRIESDSRDYKKFPLWDIRITNSKQFKI